MSEKWRKAFKYAGGFFLITILLELTLFQYRYYESRNLTPPEQITVDYLGLVDNQDGTWTADSQDPCIEFSFPLTEIKTIKLDLETIPHDTRINQVELSFFLSDEGSEPYYEVPQSALYNYTLGEQAETITTRTVLHHDPTSQYIRLRPGGQVRKIKVMLHINPGQVVQIHDMALNAQRPFSFSALRVLLLWGLGMLVYLLSPKHSFFETPYRGERWQKAVIFTLAAVYILTFAFLTYKGHYSEEPGKNPYVALSRSLAKGQVYLDDEPPAELLEMENPYDTKLRNEKGIGYLWDHAYYQGKYYVYFGVMPALIYYLPWYLLTGNDFPAHLDFYIMSGLYVAGIFLFLGQLIKKYFQKASFMIYLLLSSALVWGGGVVFLALHPDFYSIPKYFSVVMTVWGLYFWLSGRKAEGKISMGRLVAGSACMASVAGGRTQMVLGSFLAIFLLGDLFIKKTWRDTFRKENMKNFLIFFSPFILIAGILMLYNFSRFGSVFDFGANYNLTTNDMTKRGMNIDRCGLAVFTYLLQPPYVISQFPYITEVNLVTNYPGITITEGMRGGLLLCNPFLLILLFQNQVKERLKEKRLYWFNLFCLLSGLVIAVADAQMAGLLVGYTGDFAIFFFLPAITTLLALLESVREGSKQNHLLLTMTSLSIFIGITYNVLSIFVRSRLNSHSSFFYLVRQAIEFWQ